MYVFHACPRKGPLNTSLSLYKNGQDVIIQIGSPIKMVIESLSEEVFNIARVSKVSVSVLRYITSFIWPFVMHCPHYTTRCAQYSSFDVTFVSQEIFGPILTVYVYPDAKFEETINLVNTTTIFALTGAVFAKDK